MYKCRIEFENRVKKYSAEFCPADCARRCNALAIFPVTRIVTTGAFSAASAAGLVVELTALFRPPPAARAALPAIRDPSSHSQKAPIPLITKPAIVHAACAALS